MKTILNKKSVLRRLTLFCAVFLLAAVSGLTAVFGGGGGKTKASADLSSVNTVRYYEIYENTAPSSLPNGEGLVFSSDSPIFGNNRIFDLDIAFKNVDGENVHTHFIVNTKNLDVFSDTFLPPITPNAVFIDWNLYQYTAYAVVIYADYYIYSLPSDPVQEGYTFVGWYWNEELTIPYNGEPIYEDTVLYSKFVINQYVISFNTKGGEFINSVTVDWGTEYIPPTPTRIGYNFSGWYLNGESYNSGIVTENITLTAQWQLLLYTLVFKQGNAVYATLQVPYGANFAFVSQSAGLSVFNKFLDSDGNIIPTNATIPLDSAFEGDIIISVVEMTGFEKFIAWFKNFWWFIFVVFGVILLAVIVIKIIRRIRG